jgi:hypothetical protein
MTLDLDKQRALASLATISGYRVLLDEVLKSKREDALQRLKLAKGQEARGEAGLEFAIWDDVIQFLERIPTEAVAALKEEGDPIYG